MWSRYLQNKRFKNSFFIFSQAAASIAVYVFEIEGNGVYSLGLAKFRIIGKHRTYLEKCHHPLSKYCLKLLLICLVTRYVQYKARYYPICLLAFSPVPVSIPPMMLKWRCFFLWLSAVRIFFGIQQKTSSSDLFIAYGFIWKWPVVSHIIFATIH